MGGVLPYIRKYGELTRHMHPTRPNAGFFGTLWGALGCVGVRWGCVGADWLDAKRMRKSRGWGAWGGWGALFPHVF